MTQTTRLLQDETETAMNTCEKTTAAEERAAYESTTIGMKVGDKSFTIAVLRVTFETFCQNPEHWKLPYTFAVPADLVAQVFAACQFYLASTIHGVEVERNLPGYVTLRHEGYKG